MTPFEAMRLRRNAPITQVQLPASLNPNYTSVRPTGATCTLALTNLGKLTSTLDFTNYTWLLYGLNSDYQVRLTVNSGSIPTGASTGSWLSLASSRSWAISQSGSSVGTTNSNCTLEIRRISDNTVLATASVTFSATVES